VTRGRSLGLLLALALLVTWHARGLPLVRNSLVYARASEHVIAHGYDPRPVVADSALSYDKPILYAWVSAPFVRWLGNHDGLRVTSFLTTAAYLVALVAFARAHRALLPPGGEQLVLWLAGFGPCVFYQFWSAHPDGAFAALVTLAWALCRRITDEPGRDPRTVWALGVVVLVAVLLKNYGLILLGACPLYLLWHARAVRRRLLLHALAVFAVVAAFAGLAWAGLNPLSRLAGEGGGVGQYGRGELWVSARGTWIQLGLALALQFTVCLALVAWRRAWSRALVPGLVCFALPYVAGLMPFPTTFYNMRYFLPLFPPVALIVARGLGALRPALRRGLLGVHAVLAAALVLCFNVPEAYRLAAPVLPRLEVDWIRVPLSLLDNLRMPQHLEQAAVLARIDALPAGATLYLLDVNYYRDAQHGVYERAGLIRPDITTRYVASRGFAPSEPVFFVLARRAPDLSALGQVVELGPGLYRVERSNETAR